MASISGLSTYAQPTEGLTFEGALSTSNDLMSDFEGRVAFIGAEGILATSSGQPELWHAIVESVAELQLASSSEPGPVISTAFTDPASKHPYIIVSSYSPSTDVVTACAFSPANLAKQTLAASYPADSQATIYLLDSSGQLLFTSGSSTLQNLPTDHPGVAEALRGENGTKYVQIGNSEHVIAYSAIPSTGWALITEEDWHAVVSPSLQTTQLAPLVLVPAFILALFALWFGARQIVQPLQRLESKAAALAWGDFETIKNQWEVYQKSSISKKN